LARTGEIGEPRGKNQVGSSAMPWKQNPMKAERLNSLARTLPGYKIMADMTCQTQGLERTLDDSAGRRVYMSGSFLTLDACLLLALELLQGLNVFENVVHVRLNQMLPFLATEEILSFSVKQGLPRQDTHHFIMQKCKEVWSDISNGVISKNDLLDRLKNDQKSPLKNIEIPSQLSTKNYIGLCESLCEDFRDNYIPIVDKILYKIDKNTVIVEKSSV
jgi:adenylosuccinate lyase